ncbi:hypothetical protein ACFLZT_00910 [Thermodesulfobacteriota bacterium]
MKKVSFIAAALFLMAILISPMGCETAPQGGPPGGPGVQGAKGPGGPGGKGGPGAPGGKGGPGGKAKGKAKGPTHEEFVEMYDKNGDGRVSMEEFIGE